jgi:hypothetical protein
MAGLVVGTDVEQVDTVPAREATTSEPIGIRKP